MKDFFYQIKGKDTGSGFGNWAWPPIASGKVTAPDRKTAISLIEEEYGKTFPLRVLQKDLDSNEFLLTIKEILEDDHYLRGMFDVRTCKRCGSRFKMIEKYMVNNPGGGTDYCCRDCRNDQAAEDADYAGYDAPSGHPPVIYRITNKATGLCYIGKTRQAFTLRWYQHFFQGTTTKFHKTIHETPITAWTFEVLEVVTLPKGMNQSVDIDTYLSEREAFYITAHNSIINGYNTQGRTEGNGELFDQRNSQ
jgi:hypothetical protein